MSIRCAHILQKHTGSRNPTDSYRNKAVTRTITDAKDNINHLLAQVTEDNNLFGALAM